jgi:Diadenosine tetraphosphate (Ap4A) hydrolase and other HIT family hydrolases
MDDCLFCKLAQHQIQSAIIYEDEMIAAILDIHPIAPGHTFIIPKEHFFSVLDLNQKYFSPLWEGIIKVEKMLTNAFHPDGFTIGINQGRSAGQAIDHLHIHIIPRFLNDGGKSLHSVVFNPPQENLEEIKNKILKSNNAN